MLFLYYAVYLFLGSVCLVQGAPVRYTPASTSNLHGPSSSSWNPTFRKHSTFQKIHITNTNPNPTPKSTLSSPSFLTNPPNLSYSISQRPSPPSSWPRKIYGFFVNHARHHLPDIISSSPNTHQHSILGSAWLPDKKKHNTDSKTLHTHQSHQPGSKIYALIRHLRRSDRVWAPVVILFTMSGLAVVAMGVVDCIGACWEKGTKKGGQMGDGGLEERVLFDGGILEEVVIEAVPVDEDEDADDYECQIIEKV